MTKLFGIELLNPRAPSNDCSIGITLSRKPLFPLAAVLIVHRPRSFRREIVGQMMFSKCVHRHHHIAARVSSLCSRMAARSLAPIELHA
jgi:hypothetical protein